MEPSARAKKFVELVEITLFANEYKDYERSEKLALMFDAFERENPAPEFTFYGLTRAGVNLFNARDVRERVGLKPKPKKRPKKSR